MKILFGIFLRILAEEASIKELEDDIKGEFGLRGRTLEAIIERLSPEKPDLQNMECWKCQILK